MKIAKLVLFLLTLSATLVAQQPHSSVLCGYDLIKQQLERQYPGFIEQTDKVFEEAKRRGQESQGSRSDVYTIPVVVHVVWKETEENLSDSIIQSQIDVLNEDFRRLNANADDVRPIFEPVVGDPMIEFELVATERVETTSEFSPSLFGLPDEVKRAADGGSDAWDTDSYLNIWVCHLQPLTFGGQAVGLILGYAYPPADLPNWPDGVAAPSPELDGVVIDYKSFGRSSSFDVMIPGSNQLMEFRGRTAVHEIGHYLGLRHIWGDGGGIFGGDSCEEDDGVTDTPNTGSQANWGCDATRNTCIDPSNDLPDMIENYMDYASESCMSSFTEGQINIMRGVLEGPRCNLVENCNPTSVKDLASEALALFPNPTRGEVFLQLGNRQLTDYQVQVRSLLGAVVPVEVATDNSQINLSGLPTGIYWVELSNREERVVGKVLVR